MMPLCTLFRPHCLIPSLSLPQYHYNGVMCGRKLVNTSIQRSLGNKVAMRPMPRRVYHPLSPIPTQQDRWIHRVSWALPLSDKLNRPKYSRINLHKPMLMIVCIFLDNSIIWMVVGIASRNKTIRTMPFSIMHIPWNSL